MARAIPLINGTGIGGNVRSISSNRPGNDRAFVRQTADYSQRIIETISQPIAVLDRNFRITLANPSFYRQFKVAENPVNGAMFPYLRHSGKEAARLRAGLRAVFLRGKKMNSLEFQFRQNGRPRIFLINAQPLFRAGASSPLLLMSAEDITERHDAEEVREHLVAELGRLANELEDRVAERSVELQKANAKLQTLSARLLEAQELERRHLARELHDEIGQQITCLQILTEQQLAVAPPGMKKSLKEIRRATTELLQTVRQLSSELRPQLLDDFGVLAALEWHIRRFQKRTAIEVRLNKKNFRDDLLNSFLRNVLFRVAQEALTNVARHAHTKRVDVQISTRNGLCRLMVRDKGTGFNVNHALQKGSFGLTGMRERVFLAGGKLKFESARGKGTTVTVELPLSSPHADEFDRDHLPESP